jgi:periplasmic divalent cation tolerance protein
MSDPVPPTALVVLTTLASREQAETLGRSLVEDRLVACGTIFDGVRSIFRWKGEVHDESETVALLKTTEDRWEALQTAIGARHPYDVPELVALPVRHGLVSYLRWVADETD